MVPNRPGGAASPYAERAIADLRNHRGRARQRQRGWAGIRPATAGNPGLSLAAAGPLAAAGGRSRWWVS